MMRPLLCLIAAAALHAQTVATVNGKPVTRAELDAFKSTLPPQMASLTGENFLRYYGFVLRMAELAEKSGLADKSPYKEQLALQRVLLLSQAMGAEYGRDVPITPEDERKYYDQHKDRFVQADVRALRVPDKTKAAEPAEFSAVPVTQIRRYDDNVASQVRDAVFAAKPGEFTGPISQPDGVYIYRVDRIAPQPFSEVRGYAAKAVSDERVQSWIAGVTKSVTVQ